MGVGGEGGGESVEVKVFVHRPIAKWKTGLAMARLPVFTRSQVREYHSCTVFCQIFNALSRTDLARTP